MGIAPPTAPLTGRASQPSAIVGGDPVAAINRFYSAVTAHQFGAAASTWSARMQAQYPPPIYIDHRFADTQYIGLTGNHLVSEANGTAVIYVNVAEVIGGQNRVWVGTWQLVDTSSGWLLNSPNLTAG
jgi:hypothetical protein